MKRKSTYKFIIQLILLIVMPYYIESQTLFQSPYYSFPRNSSQQIDLENDWELSFRSDTLKNVCDLSVSDWLIVKNPTSVQMAIFKAGRLPNPYVGLNSVKYKELEQKVWCYKKSFSFPVSAKGKNLILSFDGIDYYAKIWLNGQLLGTHEGMFGGPVIDISGKCLVGERNELIVQVLSANYKKGDYLPRRPGKVIKPWFFTGGSGVEPFFHVGMWRGARIDILPSYHIERPFLFTKKIDSNKAVLGLQLELFSGKNSLDYSMHPWDNRMLATYHSPLSSQVTQNKKVKGNVNVVLELSQAGKICYQKEFTSDMIEGRSWLEEEFEMPNPKLWFPNEMGNQNLYVATLKLMVNQEVVDVINFDFGVRTIEQVRSAGIRTQDRWANWQFVINGKKQFIKGMNWMPIDALSDLSIEKYNWLISAAKNAGIQMFRVWGSGYIETKEFYDLCNKNGILVWQDFPIANFDTPDWNQATWEEQVCQNIFRLRNEPSLAVWCGGNEFNPYSNRSAATIGVLERNLREFDPTRLFLRTSPEAGSMHSYPDFDPNWYKGFSLIPFVAETGIHCMTDARGNREVIDDKEFYDLNKMADSAFAKTHPEFVHHFVEYVPTRVPRMLSRASHIVDISKASYDDLVEATQIGAGEFYQIMSESFQNNYPVTTGLMPWTYNRPWPTVAAINLIDGFGQPTAPYYFLKQTYQKNRIMLDLPRLLWKSGERVPLDVKLLNLGNSEGYTSIITVKILDNNFKQLFKTNKEITVTANSTVEKVSFNEFKLPENYKNKFFFMVVESRNEKAELMSQAVYWPRTIPQMETDDFYKKYTSEPIAWPTLDKEPWLKPTVAKNTTQLKIENLSVTKFDGVKGEITYIIKNIGANPAFMNTYEIENLKRIFYASENFYWLNAGESKEMKITFQLREKAKTNQLEVSFRAWNANPTIIKLKLINK